MSRHAWVRPREDGVGNDVICDEHSTVAHGVRSYRRALGLAKLHEESVEHEGEPS